MLNLNALIFTLNNGIKSLLPCLEKMGITKIQIRLHLRAV